jgi:hypothetical protein
VRRTAELLNFGTTELPCRTNNTNGGTNDTKTTNARRSFVPDDICVWFWGSNKKKRNGIAVGLLFRRMPRSLRVIRAPIRVIRAAGQFSSSAVQ